MLDATVDISAPLVCFDSPTPQTQTDKLMIAPAYKEALFITEKEISRTSIELDTNLGVTKSIVYQNKQYTVD